VSGVPDVVRISLTATAFRPAVAEALAASEDAARRIREVLARFALTGADAATSTLTVQAEQVWENERGPRVTGYRAEHGIEVILRDLAAVGPVIGEALSAGADDARLNDVAFDVEDGSSLRARARQVAWEDALSRARELAALAGRPLGAVLYVAEGDPPGQGPPVPLRNAVQFASGSAVAPEPGRVRVAVDLRVHWALR
jgi:uncharacterized protein YggE